MMYGSSPAHSSDGRLLRTGPNQRLATHDTAPSPTDTHAFGRRRYEPHISAGRTQQLNCSLSALLPHPEALTMLDRLSVDECHLPPARGLRTFPSGFGLRVPCGIGAATPAVPDPRPSAEWDMPRRCSAARGARGVPQSHQRSETSVPVSHEFADRVNGWDLGRSRRRGGRWHGRRRGSGLARRTGSRPRQGPSQ
jgi:hypothetical protein